MSDSTCPKCSEECYRDEVDVEVGIIYGPYGCPHCGWSSDSRYDCSNGPCKEQLENYPDCYIDQYGGLIKRSTLEEACDRFGVDKNTMLKTIGD